MSALTEAEDDKVMKSDEDEIKGDAEDSVVEGGRTYRSVDDSPGSREVRKNILFGVMNVDVCTLCLGNLS